MEKGLGLMKVEEIPVTIWVLLGGQFMAFIFAWGRALLNISHLKQESEDHKLENKEETAKQNKTISAMYDKVSATREDVATIKGLLGARSTDTGS